MAFSDIKLSYKSIKFITIENTKLALTNYALMIAVLVYVMAYTVIIQQGYQEYDDLIGTVSAKVKGTASVGDPAGAHEFFDEYDLIIPPLENDALFVTTNFVFTPNQTKGICPGDGKDEQCPCQKGDFGSNGINTGTCQNQNNTGACMMQTWCPLEIDDPDHYNIMNHVDDWTVFIKANIVFPRFNIQRTNAEDENGDGSPTFGENLFSVSQMIEAAGSTMDDLRERGGIILVSLLYDCDLNSSDQSKCKFATVFRRIDDVPGSISPGFNYRFKNEYERPDGGRQRDLYKMYGIRFIFEVTGRGGKFSFAALTITIGAGLGFLGLATVICDIILEYFMEQKADLKNRKYQRCDSVFVAEGGRDEPFLGSEQTGINGSPDSHIPMEGRKSINTKFGM